MSYLERRLQELDARRKVDEISRQIEEQQKLEKESTKSEKDISVGKTALEYGTAPLILPKYFQEDGKYMKQSTILGFPVPFTEEEITQDEFVKGQINDIKRKRREGKESCSRQERERKEGKRREREKTRRRKES